MSGYTGVSDYNSATRAWKDRVSEFFKLVVTIKPN